MVTVDQMKKKPKANRSIQDQSKYKAAVQIIAKNPDIVKQMGTSQGQQTQQ
jgi:ribosomal protein S17